MGTRNAKVDAYIAGAQPFAREILTHIREVVHAACPSCDETMKWSMPFFTYKGALLCNMAAFKAHASFGFWLGMQVLGDDAAGEGMGQFGKLTSVKELPSKAMLTKYVKRATALVDAGVKLERATSPAKTAAARMAAELEVRDEAVTLPPPVLSVTVTLPAWVPQVVDFDAVYATDADRMRLAIRLSRENVERGTGGPFGAAVFERHAGRLVAVGVNEVVTLGNSTLHAEMVALQCAERRVRSYSLHQGRVEHDLFTSCAPCAMCLGAALWSGVTRLVAAADREDAERAAFDEGPVFAESYAYLAARGLSVVRGFLRDEAAAVLDVYRRMGGVAYNG